jgi:hypothetical protein
MTTVCSAQAKTAFQLISKTNLLDTEHCDVAKVNTGDVAEPSVTPRKWLGKNHIYQYINGKRALRWATFPGIEMGSDFTRPSFNFMRLTKVGELTQGGHSLGVRCKNMHADRVWRVGGPLARGHLAALSGSCYWATLRLHPRGTQHRAGLWKHACHIEGCAPSPWQTFTLMEEAKVSGCREDGVKLCAKCRSTG